MPYMAYRAEYNPESARNVMHAIFFCSQSNREPERATEILSDSLWLSLSPDLLTKPFGSKGPCLAPKALAGLGTSFLSSTIFFWSAWQLKKPNCAFQLLDSISPTKTYPL